MELFRLFGRILIDNDEANRSMQASNQQAQELGQKFSNGIKTAARWGAAIATGAVAAGGAIVGLVASTTDLNRDLARLAANASNMGYDFKVIEDQFKKVAQVTGETDSAVETLSNLMQSGFSDVQMAAIIDDINGAAIRFSDTLKTEGIADGIQETFATGEAIGQFGELLERSGVNLEVFNAGLAEAKKNGTETDYVLQQLADLGLASAYEEYQRLNPELAANTQSTANFEIAMAKLGVTLAPIATAITNFITAGMEWVSNSPKVQKAVDAVEKALSNYNVAIGWIKDNGVYIIAAIAGVVGALAAFKILTTINTAIGILNTLMIAYRAGTIAATLAQMGLNVALLASPLTWIAIAIGAVIAAGVLLYKNWDIVKAKTLELWAKIKENPFAMLLIKMNPITAVAMKIYNNFDKIKTAFTNFKNAIANFKLPGWVTSIGSTLSNAASRVRNLIPGHATGLERVPYDNYTARLHAGEAVLTANQSNALRSMGMLSSNPDGTPKLNLAAGGQGTSSINIAPSAVYLSDQAVGEIVFKVVDVLMQEKSNTELYMRGGNVL